MDSEVNNLDTRGLAISRQKNNNNSRKWAILVAAVGVIALVVGLVIFIINKNSQPHLADADYLISAGEWQREDQPAVIWNFTSVGGGELTTDEHLNNYAFSWSLNNGKLKIETNWLYDLNDEFSYVLDQGGKTLTIKNEDKGIEVKFKAKDRGEKSAQPINGAGGTTDDTPVESNTIEGNTAEVEGNIIEGGENTGDDANTSEN